MNANEAINSQAASLPRSPELMNAGDTLLCLVDLQERLVPVIQHHERIVWNIRRLLDGAKVLGVEVVATEQYPEKLGPTVEPLASRIPSPAASKLAFSSAGCTDVFARQIEQLDSGGKHRVLLTGIETHVCVQQTAYDLLAAGFQVLLAVDATGTRFSVDYETALRRMESAGVMLTTTESALFEWCVVSGTPEFKQVSQLVREPAP
ncbi:isochorismatase family protein [Aeoliella sp. ICT_H6.2]|uniref:Isochorismatase family protein n=1 Tax=Aeoliella straminimaris TaxID=2954799 RepID=A0A9X2FFM0_9BACT|nr:isochorismatase family protein [Aeoliella straminimaris]MCO6047889.1 isochorismatase family protein [Aeoliella straminimaris]